MFKQLFKNAFNPKESKFGYNVDFVNGTLNHNPISKIKAGNCTLNFENQTFIFKQGEQTLIDNMSDIESIRTWTFKGKQYFSIETKTYNEYKFAMPILENETIKHALLKPLFNIADAFNITIQDDGESEE